MSTFPTVAGALKTVLAARDALTDVTVRYGEPRFAEDLQSGNAREAVWIEGPGEGNKTYPYLTPGAKPTAETYTLELVIQVEQGADAAADPNDSQLQVDTRADALLDEVEAAIAADVHLGLSSPKPLTVAVEGWQAVDPPNVTAESYYRRIRVVVRVDARIPAPS